MWTLWEIKYKPLRAPCVFMHVAVHALTHTRVLMRMGVQRTCHVCLGVTWKMDANLHFLLPLSICCALTTPTWGLGARCVWPDSSRQRVQSSMNRHVRQQSMKTDPGWLRGSGDARAFLWHQAVRFYQPYFVCCCLSISADWRRRYIPRGVTRRTDEDEQVQRKDTTLRWIKTWR